MVKDKNDEMMFQMWCFLVGKLYLFEDKSKTIMVLAKTNVIKEMENVLKVLLI